MRDSAKRMTESEIVDAVKHEMVNALGQPGGDIGKERALAWDYYLSRPIGNEKEGQSKIVTSDVSEVIDSIMPSLLRLFTTADNLLIFDPQNKEDIKAAKQESDYVNYQFFKKNAAFLILYTWFFDALVQKNGIVKAMWDDSDRVTQERYFNLDDETFNVLKADDELELVEDEKHTEMVVLDLPSSGGVVPQEVTVKLHDATFNRTDKKGFVAVYNVPPEEYRISNDACSVDPESARMVGQVCQRTRSDLLEMGFSRSLVDKCDATIQSVKSDTAEGRARLAGHEESLETPSSDWSQELVTVDEAYMKVDFDGDGYSERRLVMICGDVLLKNERVDRQPFHVLSPQPLPHKHFGRATAEKVMDIQQVSTTLLRQVLTNLYHTNNPGHAVWEQGIGEDTLDDLLDTRIGRVARFARPPGEAYAPMSVPFTAAATFPMLEYFDKAKRDRTGIHSDAEGLSPDALKNIQQSVMGHALDLSRMKIEAIARIFAETGLKSLFLHIHELVLKHQDKQDVVQLRGEWVEIDPREWRARKDMTVQIGLGIGTRESNLQQLSAIKDLQASIVEAGGMNLLVTPQNIYQTASEFVKNANLKDPALFFTDPGDKPAPPPSDEQQKMEQEKMEIQKQQQQIEMTRQQLAAQKAENDKAKHELKQMEAMLDAKQAQTKMQLDHEAQLAKLEAQSKRDEDAAEAKANDLAAKLTELELKYNAVIQGAIPSSGPGAQMPTMDAMMRNSHEADMESAAEDLFEPTEDPTDGG